MRSVVVGVHVVLVLAVLGACSDEKTQLRPGALGLPSAAPLVEPGAASSPNGRDETGAHAANTRPLARGPDAPAGRRDAALAPTRPTLAMKPHVVVDRKLGGISVGTLTVPAAWDARSRVDWKYTDTSAPVRIWARVEAPDGSAFLEAFPAETFYWLQPRDPRTPVGHRALGMIHRPGITAEEALRRFIIARYRKGRKNLRVGAARRVRSIPEALGKPAIAGESLSLRVTYEEKGRAVEEAFFGHLSATQRIPYRGPQGTTYELHRTLTYPHSMGARGTSLGSVQPLLGFIIGSWQSDPAWEKQAAAVYRRISKLFNQNMAKGYAQIAAAGAMSRAISANNDAMLRGMSAQRAQRNAADAQRRVTAQAQAERGSATDGFSQYLRGVERTKDPYWGTSEHSYQQQYHWTDGQGGYRHSNDVSYNPNLGASQSWTLMDKAP